jgi:protein deglycase
MSKRVLCILVDGFEEIEAVTPIDLLRRAEVEVVIASLHGGVIQGRSGLRLEPDGSLDGLSSKDFDLLLIPGGPGVGELRRDGRAVQLARDFVERGKLVAAICAAPLILHDAGILGEHRFTAHFSTEEEISGALDQKVVEDGLIITSRGAGTALDFGLALVERLVGKDVAEEVAAAIMA